ncbi:MAG: hypothetical protein JWQ60_3844 [Pseudonocardia sp.]|nr:hypothetical protein [Pseudonocardia sp.]
MTLSPAHARWLGLIRYQALAAIEQARQPAPLVTLAINGLHDAVESMLGLVVEHRQIATKQTEFDALFADVVKDVPELAVHRSRMKALNKARVGFKHHGNALDSSTVDRHRASAEAFLAEAAQEGLGTDFERTAMIEFVRDERARELIERAEQDWVEGDGQMAVARLKLAADRLLDDYEERKTWHPGASIFVTRPNRPTLDPSRMALGSDRLMDWMEDWVGALDDQSRLVALGVDVRAYAFLRAYSSNVMITRGGAIRLSRYAASPPITEDVYRRCQRFVIDTALHLGESDYEFDAWASREARYQETGQWDNAVDVRVVEPGG